MRRYRAPYGNGFYEIGLVNGNGLALFTKVQRARTDIAVVENDYDERCERIANLYM